MRFVDPLVLMGLKGLPLLWGMFGRPHLFVMSPDLQLYSYLLLPLLLANLSMYESAWSYYVSSVHTVGQFCCSSR